MTDSLDVTLRDRYGGLADPLPDPDYEAVKRRASEIASSTRRPRSLRRPARRTLLIAAVAAAVLAGGATALAKVFLGPAPALTAGVSALSSLPPAAPIPTSAANTLRHEAPNAGITADEAIQRTRLLRTGLLHGEDLYAFEGQNHAVCLVAGTTGACLSDAKMGDPGVLWVVSPGYPGDPAEVLGIVADDVASLALTAGGSTRPVPIINNAFFAGLPQSDSDSYGVELTVRYQDGSTRQIGL
jgi:hypothetical protein